jgi:hypothetical protein
MAAIDIAIRNSLKLILCVYLYASQSAIVIYCDMKAEKDSRC